jgi:hypothetical protein
MASNINPNNIDGSYPVAGQDNNSQGFRDNFTNTKQNFQYAEDEINDLQSKAVLKAALTGQALDNNMNDALLYAARIQDFAATKVAVTGTSGAIVINYASGHYQTISTSGSVSLTFQNFPSAGIYGYMRIQFNITNVAHTVTLPSAVSLGLSGIQGISPGTSGVSNTITFGATGYYEFAFSTSDGGSTITLFDLNRALTNFTSADINTDDITATGNITATGVGKTAAFTTVTATGNITATGNTAGGNLVTGGRVVSTGNVVGGNLVTGGLVTATGNVVGLNINGFIYPTAGTTSAPALDFTAGSLLTTPAAGAFEYDGTVFYSTPVANQRGVSPSAFVRVQVNNNTLSDTTSAQAVFSSPSAIGLAASTAYQFEAVYYITRAAGTTSHTTSVLFNATSALTSIAYVADATTSTGVALTALSRIYGTATTGVVVTGASTSATENLVITLRGIIKTNAATTLTPQFQYSAAPGGAPTVLANSYFKLIPLGTSSVISVGNWS